MRRNPRVRQVGERIARTIEMDDYKPWSTLFDDLLLRSQVQFRDEFLNFLLHQRPGENMWTYLLDSLLLTRSNHKELFSRY